MKYIFLHGMGQNASSWDKTISFLPDGTETVCPELSDFFTEGNCQYNKMYAAFCDYCNSFSEPPNLCGLSLGAVFSLNYAVDFPQKVSTLTLIAPQYDMPKFLLKVQNVLFKFMPASQFKDIGLTKNDFITLTNSMADMDFTSRLDKVNCPVLVLCGEKDNVNKKAAVKLAKKLRNAKFSTIKNSGHEVNIDNPQGLAKTMGTIMYMYLNDPRYHEEFFGQAISFSDMNNKSFDLYCYPEHPCEVIRKDKENDLLFLNEDFHRSIVRELKNYNRTVYRVSTSAFAVPHNEKNPPSLSVTYKSKNYTLSKRKVIINNMN